MENQKRGWLDNVKTFGCAAIMLLLIFGALTVVFIGLFFGFRASPRKMAILFLAIAAIAGAGFLLNKGLEKFSTHKFQYEGEQFTSPRDIESRSNIVGGIWLLVYIALFSAGVYFDLPGAVRAFIVVGIGTVMSIFTYAAVASTLAPDIKGLKSDDEPAFGKGEDRMMHYIFLVLFTNATLTTIATFIFMLFVKYRNADLSE